jgi:hypothetical protein
MVDIANVVAIFVLLLIVVFMLWAALTAFGGRK